MSTAAFNIAQTWNNPSSQSAAFWNRAFFIPNSGGASEILAANGFPADLSSAAVVGPGANFGKGNSYGLLFTYGPSGGGTKSHHRGNFTVHTNYVGFKFLLGEQPHFGWARMKITLGHGGYRNTIATTIHLLAYGFETTANQPIEVNANCQSEGQPDGASPTRQRRRESSSVEQPGSLNASALHTTIETPQPASLGALALGAQGLPRWRK
jgi:hypothetical protein